MKGFDIPVGGSISKNGSQYIVHTPTGERFYGNLIEVKRFGDCLGSQELISLTTPIIKQIVAPADLSSTKAFDNNTKVSVWCTTPAAAIRARTAWKAVKEHNRMVQYSITCGNPPVSQPRSAILRAVAHTTPSNARLRGRFSEIERACRELIEANRLVVAWSGLTISVDGKLSCHNRQVR